MVSWNPGVGDSGSRLAQPRSRLPLPGNVKDSVSWDLSQSRETVTIISSGCTLSVSVKWSVPDRIRRSRYFGASLIQIRILFLEFFYFFFLQTLRSIFRDGCTKRKGRFCLIFLNLLGGIWGPLDGEFLSRDKKDCFLKSECMQNVNMRRGWHVNLDPDPPW
jgi:hypothetical protein